LEQLEDRTVPTGILQRVAVINPSGSSSPSELVNLNGTLIFSADDGVHGRELWKSDGTAVGTKMVADINPGSASSNPTGLTVVGSVVYFAANDGTGVELWKTDGTTAGTTLVKNISPTNLTAVGDTLFFVANDGVYGNELWRSNGVASNTIRVADINPLSGSSNPFNLTAVGNTLYFGATDGIHGNELWKSDGTGGGTVLVKDFNATPGGALNLQNFLAVGNTLYFSALNYYYGNEVWTSNGADAGTIPVTRGVIPAETVETNIYDLTAMGNNVYFFYLHGHVNVDDLWKTDGTSAGTVRLQQFSNSTPANLTAVGDTLFFSYASAGGNQLWKSDGTVAGTVAVKVINPSGISSPSNFFDNSGTLMFAAYDSILGNELWTSDGTTTGTVLTSDINYGPHGSDPGPFVRAGNLIYFAATDPAGRQLWSLPAGPRFQPASLGVERPAPDGSAILSLDSNGNLTFDSGDSVFTFGLATDTFLSGDWADTGYDSVGAVRGTASGVAQFSLDTNGDHQFDTGDKVFNFGLNSDTFLVGDWNGNGYSKIGVVRPGANGLPVFSLDTNGNGIFDSGDQVFSFGLNGDRFVTGDWNGDGRAKIGVVRPTSSGILEWVLDTNGDGVFDAGDQVFSFGKNGDRIVVGDWNGNGKTKLGVERPDDYGNAIFSLDYNGDGKFSLSDNIFNFGLHSDTFLAGRWKPTGSLLVAADGELFGQPVQPLTPSATFAAAVNAAIGEWQRAGLDAQLVTRLHSARYSIAPLDGATLGVSSGDDITINAAAAGHGWNVNGGTMDLLTALDHEMGHTLGLDHSTDPGDVMFDSLLPGVHKAPTTQDVDALFTSLR
jgi:ELWxxDGT repeat protein